MLNASLELADAKNYPNLRIMTVAEEQSTTPLYDLIDIQEDWTSPSYGMNSSVFSAKKQCNGL